MSYDSYPPGMSTSDLMHVGEIADPFDDYFERWDDLSDEQLSDWISENPDLVVKAINTGWVWADYLEAWKEENVHLIQEEFERE